MTKRVILWSGQRLAFFKAGIMTIDVVFGVSYLIASLAFYGYSDRIIERVEGGEVERPGPFGMLSLLLICPLWPFLVFNMFFKAPNRDNKRPRETAIAWGTLGFGTFVVCFVALFLVATLLA